MTACPPDPLLEDFLAGRVSVSALETISDHLAVCSRCVERLSHLESAAAPALAPLAVSPEPDRVYATAVQQLLEIDTQAPERKKVEVGSLLREYELLEQVGEGGMGTVYRAIHTRLDKIVAVKVLSRGPWGDPAAVARFHREMKAVGRLRHPNIVTATDAGEADGIPFLVMEFIDGKNLSKTVRETGPLVLPEALRIVREVAAGLQHAHAAGLVHRDVKPSNLICEANGTVKLLDLGLALIPLEEPVVTETVCAGGSTTSDITSASRIVGTFDYMAPEQKTNAHAVDPRADVYGLGCTLWFLLTGKPPAAGDGLEPGPLPGGLSPDLWRQFLARDPDQRFQTMAGVIAALPVAPPTLRPKRHARLLAFATFVFAGILLTVVGVLAFAERPASTVVSVPAKDPESVAPPTPTPAEPTVPVEPQRPFHEQSARVYQEQWANFLHRPVVEANSLGMKFAIIPREVDLTPETQVHVSRPYEMALHEVTRGQFRQYLRERNVKSVSEIIGTESEYRSHLLPEERDPIRPKFFLSHRNKAFNWIEPGYPEPSDDDPVSHVTRYDAVAFCRWLEDRDGRKYRLPTEAEWFWAATAGLSGKDETLGGRGAAFSSDFAWTPFNTPTQPRPVGTKRPNPWRLFDAHGNVSEWCHEYLGPGPPAGYRVDNPSRSSKYEVEVARGDSYCSSMYGIRERVSYSRMFTCSTIGFRVLREIPNAPQFPPPNPKN